MRIKVYSLVAMVLIVILTDKVAAAEVLPDKALTLDFVISQAFRSSDSFREIQAGLQQINAARLEASAVFDPHFTSSFEYQDNKNEPTNSFQPLGERGWRSSLGLSASIATGTSVSASLAHEKTELRFQGAPEQRYHFNRLDLKLRQSLIRDPLGVRGRDILRSGSLRSEASRYEILEASENLWIMYANIFYQSWLLQKETEAASERLKRRAALESISQRRFKRGTSQSADHLQVRAAKISAESDLVTRKLQLMEVWRGLIHSLYLPHELLEWDPVKVLVKLDEPHIQVLETCKNLREEDLPRTSTSLLLADLRSQASRATAKASRNQVRPELTAYAIGSAGNADSKFATSVSDSLALKNKAWAVGVELEVPLFLRKERADAISSLAYADRLAASAAQQRVSTWVEFQNLCDLVSQKSKQLEAHHIVVKMQAERERSLEKRYRIGDSSAFDVVQAGDDLSLAESALYQLEVEVRMASWKASRIAGVLKPQISKALQLGDGKP